jgi:hypothetical protein
MGPYQWAHQVGWPAHLMSRHAARLPRQPDTSQAFAFDWHLPVHSTRWLRAWSSMLTFVEKGGPDQVHIGPGVP